ncbi:hypothetical protein SynMVIR181_01852 [Synechococcus sp. MVIR-18-1]|nr:hypothetical protein SynMVIR181_01852 [Synechococcus sp. MVIR-18-1]
MIDEELIFASQFLDLSVLRLDLCFWLLLSNSMARWREHFCCSQFDRP